MQNNENVSNLISELDDMVNEYLVYRGCIVSSKTLSNELSCCRKHMQPKLILDQIMKFIENFDILGLESYWDFLKNHFFSQFMDLHQKSIDELHYSILRLYLIRASSTRQNQKIIEFFEKNQQNIYNNVQWINWLGLPYAKNPENIKKFSTFFTRQWQEAVTLSLYNFLVYVFNNLSFPSLVRLVTECRNEAAPPMQNMAFNNRRSTNYILGNDDDYDFMVDNYFDYIKDTDDITLDPISDQLPKNQLQSQPKIYQKIYYTRHNSRIVKAKFNRNGTYVASLDEEGIARIWEPNFEDGSHETIQTLTSTSVITSVEWIGTTDILVAIGSYDGQLRLFDVTAREYIKYIKADKQQVSVRHVVSDAEGHQFAVHMKIVNGDLDKITLYDSNTLKATRSILLEYTGLLCLQFQSDLSCVLYTGSSDGILHCHDLKEPKKHQQWQLQLSHTAITTIVSDGKNLYCGTDDGMLHVLSKQHVVDIVDLGEMATDLLYGDLIPRALPQIISSNQMFSLYGRQLLFTYFEGSSVVYNAYGNHSNKAPVAGSYVSKDLNSLICAVDNYSNKFLSASLDGTIEIIMADYFLII